MKRHLSRDDPHNLKVVELRNELDRRGIPYSKRDLKPILIQRLKRSHSEGLQEELLKSVQESIAPPANETPVEVDAPRARRGSFELTDRLKKLEETIVSEAEGLKSLFFTYTWGPKDASIHDCYHRWYVNYGYRPASSMMEAFASLFRFHNETMNIWSHLIGFACASVAVVNFLVELYNYDKETYSMERLLLGTYIICASICLLSSTIFHWFQCISPDVNDNLLRMDLTGIALLIGSSYFPGTYLGFYCNPTLQTVYLGQSVLVLVLGLLSSWTDMKICGVQIRTVMMASLVVVGIIPCVHWLVITPKFYADQIGAGKCGNR
jgi:predicted membrane channel-forming protein YqfA (hemolysin III family)